MTGSSGEGPGAGPQSAHWFVSGRVQGVAFRFFVREAARQYGVRGDVRNLPDGRVELRAAGEDLAAFLEQVRGGPAGSRVDAVESRALDPVPEFEEFEIRF